MSPLRASYVRPLDVRHGLVDLSHGGGGRAMNQLVEELFLPAFDNPLLGQGNDGAVLPRPGEGRLVNDCRVGPLWGGNIVDLAVQICLLQAVLHVNFA